MNKKIIFFLLFLFPCIINALSYSNSFTVANKFITEKKDYSLYLDMKINKYGFNELGRITLDNNLILAGYVNKYEYEIIGSRNSYLYNGNTYYTMTVKNNNVSYISSENGILNNISVSEDKNYGFRTTHYVKEKTRVSGTGTYNDPFIFRNPDIIGPAVSYNINSDTTYTKNKIIEVKFTDESKIKNNQNVKYKWQTSNSCPSTLSEYTKSVTLGNSNEENNTYYAVASISTPKETGEYYLCIAPGIYDINDNASSGSYAGPYYLDNTSPLVKFDKDSDTTYTQSKNINVTVTHNMGLESGQSIKYRWQTNNTCSTNENDYTSISLINSSDNLSATATISLIGKTGQYYLCIYKGVKDTLGNESIITRSTGTYYVDNEQPNITNFSTKGDTGKATVTVTATDSHSKIKEYHYCYGKTKEECNPDQVTKSTNTHTFTISQSGTYHFCGYVIDNAGNNTEVQCDTAVVKSASILASYSCDNKKVGSDYSFVYTGNCSVHDDSPSKDSTSTGEEGSWRIKFLTSGTLTFNSDANIDIFVVGGGGGGGAGYRSAWSCYSIGYGGGGGGGGYTSTKTKYSLSSSNSYIITIGAGGASGSNGGTSSFKLGSTVVISAEGGNKGGVHHDPGGNGGSGGGGGGYLTAERRFAGDGGAYGNDGGASGDECAASGKGQGTTTCEFGEGTLTSCKRGNAFAYSGGGGGGGGTVDYNTKSCCVDDNGGDSWAKDFCSNYSFPTNKAFKACSTCYGDGGYYNGTINIGGGQSGGLSNTPSYSGWSNVPANTGGGGGGGGARDLGSGGAGGSGVVIIRDAR